MAVATTTAILAGAAAIGTATQVAGAISSNKKAKEFQSAIDSYQRQELVNYAALQGPSTAEEELMAKSLERRTATQIQELSKLGTRGMGIAAGVAESQDEKMAMIAAKLSAKQDEYKRMAAEGAFRVQSMQERREEADLAGLGRGLDVARQERAGYITGAAQSLMSGASILAGGMGGSSSQSPTGVVQGAASTMPGLSEYNTSLITEGITGAKPQNLITAGDEGIGIPSQFQTGGFSLSGNIFDEMNQGTFKDFKY